MRVPLRMPAEMSTGFSSVLLALVLAVMVWIAATNTELSRVTFPANDRGLPVEVTDVPGGMMVIEGGEARVSVDVLLPRGQEGTLGANDLVARVDLSGLEPGTQPVEVQVERQPGAPPFRILDWTPRRIDVTLDEVVTKELPVEVSVTDVETVPQIYQVLTPTVDPPTITLSGPRSVVEPVESAVAEVSVAGERASVTAEVVPQLFLAEGEAIESADYEMEPEQVVVDVPIQQRQGYEELIVRTRIQGEPARGYWVSGLNVNPGQVTVVGDPAIVANLDGIVNTEPVPVEGLSEGQLTFNVALELPEGVSPLEDNAVEVSVIIEPQTSSRRVTIVPGYVGLQPGLVVTNIVPSTIEVLLQGPVNELEELDLEDVVATLDLTGYTEGTALVPPAITPPGGLRAESIIPEQVEVTIDEPRGNRQVLLPVTTTGLASDLVAVVDPISITAELEGPVLPLDNLDIAASSPVLDVTGFAAGTYIMTPTLTLSEGISVTNLLPSIITVRLFPRDEIMAPTAPIEVTNLAPGLNADLNTPIAVVRVAGSGTEAALTRSPTFQVAADASGLGEGVYTLPLQVRLPAGYFLVGVIPQTVQVRITPEDPPVPTPEPAAPL